MKSSSRSSFLIPLALLVLAGLGGFWYWKAHLNTVPMDSTATSSIDATNSGKSPASSQTVTNESAAPIASAPATPQSVTASATAYSPETQRKLGIL